MYVLASGSPRRKELLKLILPEYKCVVSGCDEVVPDGTPFYDVPRILAEQKALSVAEICPDDIVIGSDTVVVFDGEIFGKPKSKDEAFSMLKELSGKIHSVLTGFAVVETGKIRSFVQKTDVEFYPLSDKTILDYIATGEPMDKAGAYGIQGKGSLLVKRINGDYFNVMGLPVAEAARFLGVI